MNFATTSRPARSVDFAAVRDKVPLEWFFEAMLGGKARKMSGALRFPVCPHCGPSSSSSVKCTVKDGKWSCFVCKNRGDVVEAASHHWGMSLKDAALKLMGADAEVMAAYTPPKPLPAIERDDSVLHEVIRLLVKNTAGPSDAALIYFLGRGIPAATVKEAVHRGLLVTLPHDPELCKQHLVDVVGRDKLTAAGLWREDAKAPAVAFRPLMFVSHEMTAAEFRVMRLTEPGEIKSLRYGGIKPWVYVNVDEERLMMTEGCLDLLAAVALGTRRSIIGLPGCENWKPEWFVKFKGRNVLTAFDADTAGVTATQNILPDLISAGATVNHHDLPNGAKDVNEQLILNGPHCRLEFYKSIGEPVLIREALLSLPGCDRWVPLQFGKISGRHIVARTGGGPQSTETIARLVDVFKRGGATVSVDPH